MTQCVACYRGGFCRPKPVVEPRVCTLFPFVDKVRCTGGVMDLTKMEWNGKNVGGGICLRWNMIAEVFKPFSGFNLWPWILISSYLINIFKYLWYNYVFRINGNFHYLNVIKLFIISLFVNRVSKLERLFIHSFIQSIQFAKL